jgi:hypothetical protein
MSKSKSKRGRTDPGMLEKQVLLAMRVKGWLAPETEAEVLEAEKTLAAERITMPTSFDHPRELLIRTSRFRTIRSSQQKMANAQTTENLARAAREGGTISPEVEERMKRDRDAAEAQRSSK